MLNNVYYRQIECDNYKCKATDIVELDYENCNWTVPAPKDTPIKKLPRGWISKQGTEVISELTCNNKMKTSSKDVEFHYCPKCS